MRIRKCIGTIAILSLVPTGIGLAITASQAAAVTPATAAVGTVYQTTWGGNDVLGTCGSPCVLTTSKVIPEGSYSVVGNVSNRHGSRSFSGK